MVYGCPDGPVKCSDATQVDFFGCSIVTPSGRRRRNKCQPLTADVASAIRGPASPRAVLIFAARSSLVSRGLSLCAYQAPAERHYHSCLAPADELGLKTAKSPSGAHRT